ncbi:PucR family transcriptional regulator [Nocardia jejuensis]|uniref:PucR family transcriptional regulator n=1 Tax=Nocardia jejuensis TaxID=328049 RepID=UPI0008346D22|nr:helix-turn-helix domain-containing protein [Nocardia jejuensis]
MAVGKDARSARTLSGKPMSLPFRDIHELSRRMVGHFVDTVAPCGALPGDVEYDDVTTITRTCLEIAVRMLDGEDAPAKITWLQQASAQWARAGVPIDTVHRAMHEGFRLGFDLLIDSASGHHRRSADGSEFALTAEECADLLGAAKVVFTMLDRMTSTVSLAYVRELRGVVREHHTAVHTLTSALLGGQPTSSLARGCGIEIAERYVVLAVSIPSTSEGAEPAVAAPVAARRRLRRLQAELALRCGDTALSLLSVDGGTVLIPSTASASGDLARLVAQLSCATAVPLTVTAVVATSTGVPAAAEQAHELLDMVGRLECAHGLYRFADLALEFQLTRPGPGREFLGSLLDPLDEHPELLSTLESHIRYNLNRQRTARGLRVHTNTVDYRLKRICQLTGLDPVQPAGMWYLRSALVARSYRHS